MPLRCGGGPRVWGGPASGPADPTPAVCEPRPALVPAGGLRHHIRRGGHRLAALRLGAEDGGASRGPGPPSGACGLHQDPIHLGGEGGHRRDGRHLPGSGTGRPVCGAEPQAAPVPPHPAIHGAGEVRHHPADPAQARREGERARGETRPRPHARHHPHHGRGDRGVPGRREGPRSGLGPLSIGTHQLHGAPPEARGLPRGTPGGPRGRVLGHPGAGLGATGIGPCLMGGHETRPQRADAPRAPLAQGGRPGTLGHRRLCRGGGRRPPSGGGPAPGRLGCPVARRAGGGGRERGERPREAFPR